MTKMKQDKTIHTLRLHECILVDEYLIMRVPGGWLYRIYGANYTVFVPWSAEFSGGEYAKAS